MKKPERPTEGRKRLSVKEAAPILGVSIFTVQRRLPFHRLGRRIVLDHSDLERFVAAHRVEAREETDR